MIEAAMNNLINELIAIRALANRYGLKNIYLTQLLGKEQELAVLLSKPGNVIPLDTIAAFKQEFSTILKVDINNDFINIDTLESFRPDKINEFYGERLSLITCTNTELEEFIRISLGFKQSSVPIANFIALSSATFGIFPSSSRSVAASASLPSEELAKIQNINEQISTLSQPAIELLYRQLQQRCSEDASINSQLKINKLAIP